MEHHQIALPFLWIGPSGRTIYNLLSVRDAKGPLFCKDPRMTRKPNAGFAKTGSQARTTILIYGGFDLIGSS